MRSAAADEPPKPSPAKRELVAVLIAADGEPSLSDNLTEVAISALAGSLEWDFVGLKELRPSLSRLQPVKDAGLALCLERAPCRHQVALATGAKRAILGRVHARAEGFAMELVLSEAASPDSERVLERSAGPTLKSLIAAVQTAARDLVLAPEAESKPPADAAERRALPSATPTPAARELPRLVESPRQLATTGHSSRVLVASVPAPPSWAHGAAQPQTRSLHSVSSAAATVGVLSFSAAAISGAIAAGTPTGNTRAQVEADLHRREGYQTAAIGFLVSGAVFATVSLVALAVRH